MKKSAKRALLITIDTLRADVLGAYGGPALTPELDRWAAEGWRFTQAYSASMLTNPSHSSILTSLYPRDHGVYDNQSGVGDSLRTLPGELGRRGTASGAVVAFPHLNPNVANLARGFDRFVPATRKERRAKRQVELALAELDSMGTDQFFFWLHIGDPHAPYAPILEHRAVRKPVTAMSEAQAASPGFQKKNPWFRKAFKKHRYAETLYDLYVAEVEAVDRALASLRSTLEARGLWDETLVVVTSDHGEGFGEHGMWFHHGGLYDETLNVPLIIRGPGVSAAVDDRLVEHVDIAPTIVDLLGAPRWEPMRGRSLVAQRNGDAPARDFAFSEHMLAQAVSVRDGEWLQVLHRKSSRQFPSYPFIAG
ncbi:MAG: sulfatase, partial [Myxococcota bacterium]